MAENTETPTPRDKRPLLHVLVGFRSRLTVGDKFKRSVDALITKFTNGSQLSGKYDGFRPTVDDPSKIKPRDKAVIIEPRVVAEVEIPETFKLFENLITNNASVEQSSAQIKADIIFRGNIIARDVTTQTLLQLRKDLAVLSEKVEKFPILDRNINWSWSDQRKCWVSPMKETVAKEVESRKTVLNQPPPGQPYPERWQAAVESIAETTYIGFNQSQIFSGALHQAQYDEIVKAVSDLQQSVDDALFECNSQEGTKSDIGEALMSIVEGVFVKVTSPDFKRSVSKGDPSA